MDGVFGSFQDEGTPSSLPQNGNRRKATGGTSLRLKGRQDLNLHGLPEEPQSYCRKWIEENTDRRTAAACFHAEASCSTPELPLRKCGAGRTRTGDLAITSRSNSNLTASKVMDRNWAVVKQRIMRRKLNGGLDTQGSLQGARRDLNPLHRPEGLYSTIELRRNSVLTAANWWARRDVRPALPLKRRLLRCLSLRPGKKLVLAAGVAPALAALSTQCLCCWATRA